MSKVRYPRDTIDEGQTDGRERVEAANDQSDDELGGLGNRGPSDEAGYQQPERPGANLLLDAAGAQPIRQSARVDQFVCRRSRHRAPFIHRGRVGEPRHSPAVRGWAFQPVAPVRKDIASIADRQRLASTLLDHQHGCPAPVDLDHVGQNRLDHFGRETRRWLVEQEDAWLQHQRARYRQRLPLATGESAGPLAGRSARTGKSSNTHEIRSSTPSARVIPPMFRFSRIVRLGNMLSVCGTKAIPGRPAAPAPCQSRHRRRGRRGPARPGGSRRAPSAPSTFQRRLGR